MTTLLALVTSFSLMVFPGPDDALISEQYLSEITRHLYRWHLDEADVQAELHRGEFAFWVRPVEPELDPGDRSRFADIILPRVGIMVRVKKADYEIPELGLNVKSEGYMITRVSRVPRAESPPPDGTTEVLIEYTGMRDYLFRSRSAVAPPGDDLISLMRVAARAQTQKYLHAAGRPVPASPQAYHLAPVSPVANEAWVFWEEGRLLFRFHADLDIDDRALWEHQELTLDLYNLDEQVVVTLDEVAGSNAYVTRDMVGRVLYNCLVLGRRVVLEPAPPENKPAE